MWTPDNSENIFCAISQLYYALIFIFLQLIPSLRLCSDCPQIRFVSLIKSLRLDRYLQVIRLQAQVARIWHWKLTFLQITVIYQKRPITFELICGFAETRLAIWLDWHCLSRHHLQTVSAWVVITLSPCMRAMQLSNVKAKWKFLPQGATPTVSVSVHGMLVAAWILLPANFPGDVLSREPMESDEITFWTTSGYGLYLICKKIDFMWSSAVQTF